MRSTIPAKSSTPDPEMVERMLYYLKLTREAERRIERVLYPQGKIVGGVYIGAGRKPLVSAQPCS